MCPLPFDIHVTLQNFESLLFKLPDTIVIGINAESIISTEFASNRSPDVAVSDLPPQQVGGCLVYGSLALTGPKSNSNHRRRQRRCTSRGDTPPPSRSAFSTAGGTITAACPTTGGDASCDASWRVGS